MRSTHVPLISYRHTETSLGKQHVTLPHKYQLNMEKDECRVMIHDVILKAQDAIFVCL